ncbi:MAG: type II toxin-antitoxin system VapC family toxin [Phascolarctobacterium sp.]|uniref:type II toxin-antitoxin system VapC family toxin n=1 Tax=Phascolarctobacterium sp. TaxID=2049039 RepID=UPI0026DD6FAD|nr:type II toxin-antitoxin system VapC family toxin [Phascolarctobacterium sp.]MDO4921437.1 type II toxin-antitoxin system VapC family toxin [Phascolarctobacterium sp.]
MKLLLDTHILLWAITNDQELTETTKELILCADNDIYFSIISVWEVQLKHLAHPKALPIDGEQFASYCKDSGFKCLPLNCKPIFLLKKLRRKQESAPHKDPFDRLLICQALDENMLFITHDHLLNDYDVANVVSV